MGLLEGVAKSLVAENASYALYNRTYVFKATLYDEGPLTQTVISIDKLDIDFNIKRTLTKEANKANVVVYNMAPDLRGRFAGAKSSAISLEAGYGGVNGIIFAGDVREINSIRNMENWETTFDMGDGLTKLKKKRINMSVRGPVLLSTILRTAAEHLDLPLSAGSETVLGSATLALEYANKEFTHGITLQGKASKVLDTFLESTGLEWSVQNGEMQITVRGDPTSMTTIKLTPETGLLGSPELGSDNILSCETLMIPDIAPGRLIQVESKHVQGTFRIQTAEYRGSTMGGVWNIEIEAEAY